MARETKVGLLVGLCIILGFAWILSAHLDSEGHDDAIVGRPDGGHVGLATVSTPADPITGEQERRLAARQVIDGRATEAVTPERAEVVRRQSLDSLFSGSVDSVVLLDTSSDAYGRVERNPAGRGAETDVVVLDTTPPRHDLAVERRVVDPVPAIRQYTVKANDSLYGIAESQYGRGRGELWKEIAKANGITDPGRIRAGMVLKVPNVDPPRSEERRVG